MQYQTVTGSYDDMRAFNKEINNLIQDGWKPQGGIALAVQFSTKFVIQAMVKEQ